MVKRQTKITQPIGQDINVTAHILIDGETTPITKTATYKVVELRTSKSLKQPEVSYTQVFQICMMRNKYVKPVNNSWSTTTYEFPIYKFIWTK